MGGEKVIMIKTGRQRMQKKGRDEDPARCANCGEKGVYWVTFEDMYSKLTVTLCNTCAEKKYEELLLGSRFPWPGEKLIDRQGIKV